MLFERTINDCFQGPTVIKAKHWAEGIGYNLQRQIQHQEK